MPYCKWCDGEIDYGNWCDDCKADFDRVAFELKKQRLGIK